MLLGGPFEAGRQSLPRQWKDEGNIVNGRVPVLPERSRGTIAFCLNVRGSEMSGARNGLLDHQICITASKRAKWYEHQRYLVGAAVDFPFSLTPRPNPSAGGAHGMEYSLKNFPEHHIWPYFIFHG